MEVTIEDSIIQQVDIFSNGSIVMEVEPEQYYNQIYGKKIVAYFLDNEIYQCRVLGNAITISYPEDEEKTDSTFTTKRMGMNRIYASDLRVDIDSSEIIGIAYLSKPDGVFYPMDQLNEKELFIPGFSWKGSLRPLKKEDLFVRPEGL